MKSYLKRALERRRRKFIHEYPQVACLAFDLISTEIALKGRYEADELVCLKTDLFEKMARRRVCLDIGANIGNHSLFFADMFSRVYAFEPNPRTFRLLEINSELVTNILPLNIGASDKQETRTAYQDALNMGATTVHKELSDYKVANKVTAVTKMEIALDKVDDVLSSEDQNQVDFIKFDVEGHEPYALEGMRRILQASGPVVAMEVSRLSFQGGKSPSVEILRELGYCFFYSMRERGFLSSLPKPIRMPVNGLFKLFSGTSSARYELFRLDDIVPESHTLLIAAKKDVMDSVAIADHRDIDSRSRGSLDSRSPR